MFGLVVVKGNLVAKTPIFHGGNEKTGSVILLNRQKFITDDGTENIPIVSGNAIRGVIRRLIFKDFLEKVGYTINVSRKGGQKLYHSLFTGGILETVEEEASGIIDIDMKRKIIEMIPPARLFGLSIGNQTIEGKLHVGQALPICIELKTFLPDELSPKTSVYNLITTVFQTRKDELRVEREEEEQAVQMMIEYEAFAPGTKFYHEFKIEDPEEIDLSCFARCLELWKEKPFIGGKSSIGLGEVQLSYDFKESSEAYLKFLEENKDKIVQLLAELEHE